MALLRKILFLDDDVHRQDAFKFDHYFDKVTYTNTAKQAIEALAGDGPFDVVDLDHDLGGKILVEEVDGTGYEVALYLKRMPVERLPKKVVVHSHNLTGSARIVACLRGVVPVEYVPFSAYPWGVHRPLK